MADKPEPKPEPDAVVLSPYEQCMLQLIESASNVLSASQLRNYCSLESRTGSGVSNAETPLRRRIALEQFSLNNPFSLLPHRPNYLLPLAYSTDPDPNAQGDVDLQAVEIEFQLSLKVVILESLYRDFGTFSFAYTTRSFWQAYNFDLSSPFRETNHEPEFILALGSRLELAGVRNIGNAISLNHQSNGLSGENSRSWNRVIFQTVWERKRWALAFRPWLRIPAPKERYPGDPLGDDNPDILDYMGHFDVNVVYGGNTHQFALMLRNNLQADPNRGAAELSWSFPVNDRVRGRLQYFHGYGENLIDYDRFNQTLGLGFELNGWL
ncbi:phospholipase A [Saccharospirillum impatiens]|uniref:phospholipase A n=1 Tax=Saccharospirillum impatiens TaxID=169438 RepID=UPI00146BDFA8|nr:phospholipase A [Saccharospirillum impatiens]